MTRRPPRNTYYFTIANGQLAAVVPDEKNQGGLPLPLAIDETAKTLKLFGWREGIYRTLFEIEQYLKIAQPGWEQLLNSVGFKLRSTKQQVLGQERLCCEVCGHSPEAELAFWTKLQEELKQQLTKPPQLDVEAEDRNK